MSVDLASNLVCHLPLLLNALNASRLALRTHFNKCMLKSFRKNPSVDWHLQKASCLFIQAYASVVHALYFLLINTNGCLSMADWWRWTRRPSGWNLILSCPISDLFQIDPCGCFSERDEYCWEITRRAATLMFPCLTRGWARSGASLCLRRHSWQFPSDVDCQWRSVWPICDQNKRQQKVSPSSRAQRPWRWTNQGHNRTYGWLRVWNRALRCHTGSTLPTYYRGCSDRYTEKL